MVKWIGLVLMTPKTCDNHGQRDKQTEFINRVKREQISLRTKLVISFNWVKIWSKKVLFLSYLSFETKKKFWVGGLSKNLVKPWA